MDKFVLRIFQSEVALQCRFAISAAHELEAALVMGSKDDIWKHLQTILVASANLSKMFWGSRGKKEAERAELRESLQVEDNSPIRDVRLRNDFEHFDERVEKWAANNAGGWFVGRNIGPFQSIGGGGLDPLQRFQHFDPDTGMVTFWDTTVPLGEVFTEIRRILPLAEAESPKPHWE